MFRLVQNGGFQSSESKASAATEILLDVSLIKRENKKRNILDDS